LPAYAAALRAAVRDPNNGPRGEWVRVNRNDLAALLGDFARTSRLLRLLVNKRHPAQSRP
jgi:hypothetical protein